jgi:hypothetical protein
MDGSDFQNQVLNALHAIQREQMRQARQMGLIGQREEVRKAIAAERGDRAERTRRGLAYLRKLEADGKITFGGAGKLARPNSSKKG